MPKNKQDEKRKPKERKAITKDEKQKTKKTRNKKNAQSVNNKSAAAPRTKNQLLSAYFFTRWQITTGTNKASRAHQKAAKTPFPLLCAYYRQKSGAI